MPKDNMMEDEELYGDELTDDELFADDEADEEDEPPAKKGKAKTKVAGGGGSKVPLIAGLALVVGLGGAVAMNPDMLSGVVPEDMVASVSSMLPGAGEEALVEEPAPMPEPDEAAAEAPAAPPKPAKRPPAVKKPAAPAPAEEAAAVPAPAKARAARVAASAGTEPRRPVANQAALQTRVSFQGGSAFLSAAEVEGLWSFANQIKGNNGQLRVKGNIGAAGSDADIAQRRADRVAEVLRRNTAFKAVKVDVSRGGDAPVEVTFTNSL